MYSYVYIWEKKISVSGTACQAFTANNNKLFYFVMFTLIVLHVNKVSVFTMKEGFLPSLMTDTTTETESRIMLLWKLL